MTELHCTYDRQITYVPARTGKELRFVRDPLNEHKIIVQLYGPRGGLHGTIRLPVAQVKEGLHLAEMWCEHKIAKQRLEEMEHLSPHCSWDSWSPTPQQVRARNRWNYLARLQQAYEERSGV